MESSGFYSIPIDGITPTGAGDYFFYLESNYETKIVKVHDISLTIAGADIVEVCLHNTPETTATPTAVAPIPHDRSKSLNFIGQSEVGVNLEGGGAWTPIVHSSMSVPVANYFVDRKMTSPILLDYNRAISLRAVTGTTAVNGNVLIEIVDM